MSKAQILAEIINRKGFQSYVEIGVWDGENLAEIARLCPNLKVLIGVDSYKKYETNYENSACSALIQEKYDVMYEHVLNRFKGDSRVIILRMSSLEAYLKVSAKYDMIFIDAAHDYFSVRRDIYNWSERLKEGGVLCGHDYCDYYSGVKEAVNDAFGTNITISDFKLWFKN